MKTRKALLLLIISAGLCLWSVGDLLSLQWGPEENREASHFLLSNGLKVIYTFNPSSEVTVMQLLIRGGKMAEPPGKEGLAYMTTRLSLEIPDRTTLQKIMTQATQFNMSSSMDFSFLSIAALSEHFESTMNLFSKILLKPLFSSIRIDGIEEAINRSREFQLENPIQLAHEKALEVFYSGTAYSGSVFGEKETIKSIKKRDVDNFYETFFTANNTAIVVSSDLDKDTLQKTLEEYFRDLPQGTSEKIETPIRAQLPEEPSIFIEKDTKQNLILLAYPLPKLTPENYVLSYLLDNLIGKGVNSIIWPLRVKEKLAYNISTRLSLYKEAGLFEVCLETDNEKMDVAREALRKALDTLFEEGVSVKTHADNLSFFKGSFLRRNETKRDRTFSLLFCEAMELGYSFLDRIIFEAENTTVDQMNSFIRDVLSSERRIEIVVGPQK